MANGKIDKPQNSEVNSLKTRVSTIEGSGYKAIVVEELNINFTDGISTLAAKTGYKLINAYIISRNTSEHNSYAIDSIQRNNDGSYFLKNVKSDLTSGIWIIAIWVKG